MSDGAGVDESSMMIRRQLSGLTGKEHDGGAVDLTKNNKYRVTKLPGVPPIFSSATRNDTPISANTDSSHRYALIVNHTAAYVWEYAAPHAIPHTFSFPLPRDTSYPPEQSPFPLASLVSPSANSDEPGLVVVMPMTGQVAYWDSIGSAVAEGLFSKRRGVEGKVPIMSGESVTSICNAEPAGFILSLSSGRLAHLALRDNAGRPGVSVTIMRGYGGSVMGGLLGALRAGSSRRDVVTVRAGKSVRLGEREVFVATARGNFSRWHVSRTGGNVNIADVDLREEILSALSADYGLREKNKDHFVVMDLDVGNYHSSDVQGKADTVELLALAAFLTPGANAVYILVSIAIAGNGRARVEHFHIIKSYTTPLEHSRLCPRIFVPSPMKTAFVVFSRAVVVVSALLRDSSLDNDQMSLDWDTREVFEDVVDFRGDIRIEIVGSGSEGVENDLIMGNEVSGSFSHDQGHTKKIKNPAVILIAKGAGVLRVEAFDVGLGVNAKAAATPVTVKSKLEQAVFYSTKDNNPLNFLGRQEITYDTKDLEKAALEISREILCSRSPYLPVLLPSLNSHFELRSFHLKALVTHLQTGAFGEVSKQVLWRLLQDAEKCEAAHAAWEIQNGRLTLDEGAGDGLLGIAIMELMSAENTAISDIDPVRNWFQRDIDKIGNLLPLVKKNLTAKVNQGRRNKLAFAIVDIEANDIVTVALTKAWDFRVASAPLYGLDDEEEQNVDSNGRLAGSRGFPPPWTSEPELLEALGGKTDSQYEVTGKVLRDLLEPSASEDVKRRAVVEKLILQLMDIAEICCKSFEERADWCEQQGAGAETILQEGITVRETYFERRGEWVKPIASFGFPDKAFAIAEKWRDFRSLVDISFRQIQKFETDLATHQDPGMIEELQREKDEVNDRLEEYFSRFGKPFATEVYGYLVEKRKPQQLLNGFENWREKYLTSFLRRNPRYAKLSWIHDVSLRDYDKAANTLVSVACKLEDQRQNQKIQLSIAKLARLAALQTSGELSTAPDVDNSALTIVYDINLELIKIQDMLYDAVKPVTQAAIDVDAAVQIGTDEYVQNIKKLPVLKNMFQSAFKRLVSGKVLDVEELVDLLTLIESNETGFMNGEGMYLALRATGLGGLPQPRLASVIKSIWRRCFLRDDWNSVADTRNRTDEQVMSLAAKTCLYTTIMLCHERGLFTPESPFTPMSPEESMFSETVEEIRARFPTMDETEVSNLGKDLMEENRRLRRFMTKTGLQNWFNGFVAQIQREFKQRAVVGGPNAIKRRVVEEGTDVDME